MADIEQTWAEALPIVRQGVTGVGVWAALNSARAITFEDGFFVLGLPFRDHDLSGHLRLPQTRRLIEQEIGQRLGAPATLRVISGTELNDWETEKLRDKERRRLQQLAHDRARKESAARSSWEHIYDQLSRKFAETPGRSLPQNRAKFFLEAVEMLADAMLTMPVTDDLAERNYARCIERVAQYSELPSAFVALQILERTFQGG